MRPVHQRAALGLVAGISSPSCADAPIRLLDCLRCPACIAEPCVSQVNPCAAFAEPTGRRGQWCIPVARCSFPVDGERLRCEADRHCPWGFDGPGYGRFLDDDLADHAASLISLPTMTAASFGMSGSSNDARRAAMMRDPLRLVCQAP